MITLETLYSQVEEALNINSDDSTISRQLIVDLIAQYREVWIRNEVKKGNKIDQDIIQDLGCVELEVTSSQQCGNIEVPNNCKLLRTKCDIPSFIQAGGTKLYTRIGPIDILQTPYKLIDFNRISYSGESRFNKKGVFAFEYNNKLYFYSSRENFKLTKYVGIRGVLVNPLDAVDHNLCSTGESCYNIEEDFYPINTWMWNYIKPLIVDELIRKQIIPEDQSNNTKDDKTEMNKG